MVNHFGNGATKYADYGAGDWVRVKGFAGFTKNEIDRAWNRAKNKFDWRGRVYCRVPNNKVDVTVAAVVFYTGAPVKTKPHPSGADHYVDCVGYRNGPCGP